MKIRVISVVILAGALGISALNSYVLPGFLTSFIPRPTTIVTGFSGGEKIELLQDPSIENLFASDFGLKLEPRKAGSVEMVNDPSLYRQDVDFLWPGNAMLARLAKDNSLNVKADQSIFSSPIVVYSWSHIAEGLVSAGVARPTSKGADGTFFVDTAKLADLVLNKVTWRSLGVDMPRSIALKSTDPNQSNSGNQFAALLFAVLSEGEHCQTARDKDSCATKAVAEIYGARGFLSGSSGDSFEGYLSSLPAANPLVAGYESQMIGWAIQNTSKWRQLQNSNLRPVILYPTPTVLSDHPMIALTDSGAQLIDALLNERVQKRAWEKHGFRSSATLGGRIEPDAVPVPDLPSQLTDLMDMPTYSAVLSLTNAIAKARGDSF